MGESVMNYRNKQQGVVLVIALIALMAISLAGVALMRSVDTSNVVSGNIAFNEAAIQMADIGAEQAYTEIMGNLSSNPNSCQFVAANCPVNSAGQPYFYPNASALDNYPSAQPGGRPELEQSLVTNITRRHDRQLLSALPDRADVRSTGHR